MKIFNEIIPRAKLNQFHEILCATGGRYLNEPRFYGEIVCVDYAPGDVKAHQEAWRLCTTTISETSKTQTWRKVLRRMKLFLRVK